LGEISEFICVSSPNHRHRLHTLLCFYLILLLPTFQWGKWPIFNAFLAVLRRLFSNNQGIDLFSAFIITFLYFAPSFIVFISYKRFWILSAENVPLYKFCFTEW
jgi:hypothetical protein